MELRTAELHLSGLIGTASHSDMQKIRIIRFLSENMLHFGSKFGCYYLQYVVVVFLALQPIVVVFSQPGSGL
jgi:hypothetical protein